VNIIVVGRFVFLIRNKKTTFIDIKQFLQVVSLGIMGTFLFYPLEGYHILATKLFIYIFIICYLYKDISEKSRFIVSVVLIFLIIPLLLFGGLSWLGGFRQKTTTQDPPRLHRTIGIPMRKDIAGELLKETMVMERSIKGASYYIVGSDVGDLSSLLAIVNNPYNQYYIDTSKGVLQAETVVAIIKALADVDFAVVETEDYNKYLDNKNEDVYMRSILEIVHKDFIVVDRYEAPAASGEGTVFHGFLVMKKKG
jgi:hypothetical protein